MDHLDIERRRDELLARFRHVLRPHGTISMALGDYGWGAVADTVKVVDKGYPHALVMTGADPAAALDALEQALSQVADPAQPPAPADRPDRIAGGAAGNDPANPEDVL